MVPLETLIKSPQVDERGIDLYPPHRPPVGRTLEKAKLEVLAEEAGRGSREGSFSVLPSNTQQRTTLAQSNDAEKSRSNSGNEAAAADLRAMLHAQQATLEEARTQAVAEGFAKGLIQGQEAGADRYATAVQALHTVVEAGRQSVMGLLVESENVIAAIVFEAVCKIVGEKLSTTEGCVAVIQQIIARVARAEIVAVRVSPADYNAMHETGDGGDPAFPDLLGLPLESDPRVELGGCILVLKGGSVDGRIETQFRNFAQSLKDAVREK